MQTTDVSDLTRRVRAIAEEAAAERDLYIVDLHIRGQKGSRVIEVYADSDEGVGLDELARLSRDIDFILETEDLVKGRYHLNVSSPGADRPLTHPRQFRQHVGRDLRVVVGEGESEETVTGALAAVQDGVLEIEAGGQRTSIKIEDIREARVELPW
jgi:ribosome maturation factor RimP